MVETPMSIPHAQTAAQFCLLRVADLSGDVQILLLKPSYCSCLKLKSRGHAHTHLTSQVKRFCQLALTSVHRFLPYPYPFPVNQELNLEEYTRP